MKTPSFTTLAVYPRCPNSKAATVHQARTAGPQAIAAHRRQQRQQHHQVEIVTKERGQQSQAQPRRVCRNHAEEQGGQGRQR